MTDRISYVYFTRAAFLRAVAREAEKWPDPRGD